ncbi:MAG: PD-(D/E)XK nuclease family protein, partial [Microbacterium sp.]
DIRRSPATSTSTAPLYDLALEPARLSPSKLQAIDECQLNWVIAELGADSGGAVAGLGTLIHAALEHADATDEASLWRAVEQRWGELEFEAGWIERAERARARDLITRLSRYLRDAEAAGTRLVSAEPRFELGVAVEGAAHPAVISGTMDRVEVTAEGAVVIVDLKTGRSESTSASAATGNPQLSAYQLAFEGEVVERGGRRRRGHPVPLPGVGPRDAGVREQRQLSGRVGAHRLRNVFGGQGAAMLGDESAERERMLRGARCGQRRREQLEQHTRSGVVIVDRGHDQQRAGSRDRTGEQPQLVVEDPPTTVDGAGVHAVVERQPPRLQQAAAHAQVRPDPFLHAGDDDGVELRTERARRRHDPHGADGHGRTEPVFGDIGVEDAAQERDGRGAVFALTMPLRRLEQGDDGVEIA